MDDLPFDGWNCEGKIPKEVDEQMNEISTLMIKNNISCRENTWNAFKYAAVLYRRHSDAFLRCCEIIKENITNGINPFLLFDLGFNVGMYFEEFNNRANLSVHGKKAVSKREKKIDNERTIFLQINEEYNHLRDDGKKITLRALFKKNFPEERMNEKNYNRIKARYYRAINKFEDDSKIEEKDILHTRILNFLFRHSSIFIDPNTERVSMFKLSDGIKRSLIDRYVNEEKIKKRCLAADEKRLLRLQNLKKKST